MVITLIGYRGTGKSSVAPLLAERLGWSWSDSDDVIIERAGCTIAEIFERDGEPGFRSLERDVMHQLLQTENLVLSAGGGAIIDAQTREQMQSAGPVVWLSASVDTIDRRLNGDPETTSMRPKLTEQGGREEIVDVLSTREPIYRGCATLTVETDMASPDAITETILAGLAPLLEAGADR